MKGEFTEPADKALRAVMWKFDDIRMPTEAERKRLARLMYLAFLDIRVLSLQGNVQKAHDLADAFHNIPLLMYSDNFSFKVFRDLLESYQLKHKGDLTFNYLCEWERLSAESAV